MVDKKKSAPEKATSGAKKKNIHNKNIAQTTDKIKCVIQKPGYFSDVVELENTLESFQNIVGGYMETLTMPYGLILMMNDEGKLKKLEPNVEIDVSDIIVGTIVVTAADDEGNFRSLTVSEIQVARAWLFQRQILRKDRRK